MSYQLVDTGRTAWHASQVNSRSIGIEHAAIPDKLPVTDAQYAASAELIAWLCGELGIPCDADHVVGHNQASPKDGHVRCCEPTLSVGKSSRLRRSGVQGPCRGRTESAVVRYLSTPSLLESSSGTSGQSVSSSFAGHSFCHRYPDLVQRNLRLGLKLNLDRHFCLIPPFARIGITLSAKSRRWMWRPATRFGSINTGPTTTLPCWPRRVGSCSRATPQGTSSLSMPTGEGKSGKSVWARCAAAIRSVTRWTGASISRRGRLQEKQPGA